MQVAEDFGGAVRVTALQLGQGRAVGLGQLGEVDAQPGFVAGGLLLQLGGQLLVEQVADPAQFEVPAGGERDGNVQGAAGEVDDAGTAGGRFLGGRGGGVCSRALNATRAVLAFVVVVYAACTACRGLPAPLPELPPPQPAAASRTAPAVSTDTLDLCMAPSFGSPRPTCGVRCLPPARSQAPALVV